MKRISKKQSNTHQTILDFALWFETGMENTVNNCLLLKKAAPSDLGNPVLKFIFPRAIDGVMERFVLKVDQAWLLIDRELKRQGLRPLGSSDKDYKHLKKIRNKLVAHRIENTVKTDRYNNWYKKRYGSYESIFDLVRCVAEKVYRKIKYLEGKGLLKARPPSAKFIPKFELNDIEELFRAVKGNKTN